MTTVETTRDKHNNIIHIQADDVDLTRVCTEPDEWYLTIHGRIFILQPLEGAMMHDDPTLLVRHIDDLKPSKDEK